MRKKKRIKEGKDLLRVVQLVREEVGFTTWV